MSTTASIATNAKAKPGKSAPKPARETSAAKRERLHRMMRELRSDAETLLANADRLLERFSRHG